MTAKPRIAIVGGGLAGLAAATALVDHNVDVELFEARRQLGGRAGSFVDRDTGEMIDHCQHVALECCSQFLAYCRRTGIDDQWQRHSVLHFFGPDGRRYDLGATFGLPAPLHLTTSLLRLGYLSWGERWSIACCLPRLARWRPASSADEPTMGEWLRAHGQSERAISRFWSVVLVSALSETLDHVALSAARKVFVDAFLGRRNAYQMWTPRRPLTELHDRVAQWLTSRGVRIHRTTAITRLIVDQHRIRGVVRSSESETRAAEAPASHDAFILAVPWHRIRGLFAGDWPLAQPSPEVFESFVPAAISSLHLWFDRPITPLPHAVFVDRMVQWVFRGPDEPAARRSEANLYYYQIVISASHSLIGRDRDEVLRAVLADLQAIWPDSAQARLVRWRMLTEPNAVFSPRPGLERIRPSTHTSIPNLFLAGDWTNTGWPATMESAVRSGHQAALAAAGCDKLAP